MDFTLSDRTIPEEISALSLTQGYKLEVVPEATKNLNLKPWRLVFGHDWHPAFARVYYWFETLGEIAEYLHLGTREPVVGNQHKVERILRHMKDRSVDGTE